MARTRDPCNSRPARHDSVIPAKAGIQKLQVPEWCSRHEHVHGSGVGWTPCLGFPNATYRVWGPLRRGDRLMPVEATTPTPDHALITLRL